MMLQLFSECLFTKTLFMVPGKNTIFALELSSSVVNKIKTGIRHESKNFFGTILNYNPKNDLRKIIFTTIEYSLEIFLITILKSLFPTKTCSK